MFDTGGAALKAYARDILRAIGALLNDVDNAISLAGHTDACRTRGRARLLNWELSADRANASRRELVAGGMRENKILRVVGLGSSLPLDAEDPRNPMNRRISLVVLNDKTERQIRGLPEEPSRGNAERSRRGTGARSRRRRAGGRRANTRGRPKKGSHSSRRLSKAAPPERLAQPAPGQPPA